MRLLTRSNALLSSSFLAVLCTTTTGCGSDQILTLIIETEEERPILTEDSLLYAVSNSVATGSSSELRLDPRCLVDGGSCKVSFDLARSGNEGVSGYVWLDVEGDDDQFEDAIIDGDLMDDFLTSRFETPVTLTVNLVSPEALFK